MNPYMVVDVFTDAQFGGNQLAVVTDARGLPAWRMQRIANEFNFAETTFVLPPEDPANTARVRIFTRAQEVPFAGHPNVGTAFVLSRLGEVFGRPVGREMRFEEIAGLVDVTLTEGGATIRAPGRCEVGPEVDSAVMARCLGLEAGDILTARNRPVCASVGLRFALAEVAPEVLPRAMARLDAFAEARAMPGLDDGTGRFSAYLYAREGDGIDRIEARMFAPLSGNFEDPATGSAAAALGAFLAEREGPRDGEVAIAIRQGERIGRPSRIALDIRIEGGRAADIRVTGQCVETMRGTLTPQEDAQG